MNPTRRNFLKASAAFCLAPLGFLLKKPLPDSFGLEIIATVLELKQMMRVTGCVNSKPYRGYLTGTLLLTQVNGTRCDFLVPVFRCRTRFERRPTESTHFESVICYRPVDFNLIDFGEEVPA